ncbi:MAG: YbfB/YjiJ family MFS transporter [Bryobacteraceae bacterium]
MNEGPEIRGRRPALAGFAALLTGIGLGRFAYSPLIPALVGQHWFTIAEADYLGATNLAGYLLGAIFASRIAHRYRTGPLLRGAMLATAVSFFACGLRLGFVWYAFWRLTAGVTGGLLMVLGVPLVLAATPAARRGRIGGLMFTGVGGGIALAGTVVPIFAQWPLPATWAALGLAGMGLTAIAWNGWPPDNPPASAEPAPRCTRASGTILFLMGAYAANAAGFVPHTLFWVDYIARGLDRGLAAGGRDWILLGIAAAAGPLLTGWIADRAGTGISLQIGLLLNSASVALPLVSTHPICLALSSLGVGAMTMGVTSLASGRVTEIVPVTEQKRVWGWMTVTFSLTYAAMGYVFSFLFSHTGSYRLVFGLGSAALLAGSVLARLSSHRSASSN